MSARWQVQLLGELRVEDGERVLTRFRMQKAGALLAYLAFHRTQAHPREVLIEMLWPDCDPEIGRNRLSTALSYLRLPLEPPGTPAGSVLLADRTTIRIHPTALITDVARMEEAFRTAGQTDSATERLEAWTRVVHLYRGELLPGYYEDWILTERQRLADLFAQAIDYLVGRYREARDLDRALEYAHLSIRQDPLREEAHQALLELYLATGQ